MKGLAGMIACLGALVAAPAQATVYDAFASFDGTQGAGNFFYLKLNGPNPATPLSVNTGCLFDQLCLQTAALDDGPAFYKSSLAPFMVNTVTVPNDRLIALPDVTGIAVAFVAPTTGVYSVFGQFNALDSQATGVGIFNFVAGVPSPAIPFNSVPNNAVFSTTVNLIAGQAVGFSFLPGMIADHDATGFTFRVTSAVPEPATWAMTIAGFGLAGAALRRRRTRTPIYSRG